jgi:hypothetical protein
MSTFSTDQLDAMDVHKKIEFTPIKEFELNNIAHVMSKVDGSQNFVDVTQTQPSFTDYRPESSILRNVHDEFN